MNHISRFPLVFMIFISLTPVLSIHFPRFLAFWPFIIGLVMSIWLVFIQKEKLIIPKTYFLCTIPLSALCLSSTLWSISPENALVDASKASAILLFGGLFIALCATMEKDHLKPYFWLFPASVIIASLLCIFDLSTDMALYHIIHQKTDIDGVNSSVMNRGIVCTIFSFFISLILIKDMEMEQKRKTALLIALSIAIITMLILTQSQSAQLAFVVGIIMLFIFPSRYRASYYILGGLITISLILTPLIVDMSFDLLLSHEEAVESNDWLNNAFIGNRLEIWDFVIAYAMENPLYGYGIEATNYVPAFEHDYIYHNKASVLHPHNFSVQLWIEFGLIGIVLAIGILGVIIKAISKIEKPYIQHIVTNIFILVILVTSMTYGLWQSWWLGEFIFIIGICTLLSKNQSLKKTPRLMNTTNKCIP